MAEVYLTQPPKQLGVGEKLLAHLQAEVHSVDQQLNRVKTIRAALLQRDPVQLDSETSQLRALNLERQTMDTARNALRQEVATEFGIGLHDATVSLIVKHLAEPLRGQVVELQRQLQELAQQLNRLNIGNLTLMSHYSAMTLQVIECLTGRSASPRYGPTGEIDHGDGPALFETRY